MTQTGTDIDAIRGIIESGCYDDMDELNKHMPAILDELEAARAEIARLREASTWKPIATAPRDGRRLLLWNGDSCVIGGYMASEEAWYESLEWEYCLNPTHWQPEPRPPEDAK